MYLSLGTRSLGFVSIIAATFCAGLYGVVSRFVGLEFGAFFLSWSRDFLVIFLALSLFVFYRSWIRFLPEDRFWFVCMSFFGAISFLLIFFAFQFLPIGVVLFTYFASATLSAFFIAAILYQEKIDRYKVFLLSLSLLGLLCLFFEQFGEGRIFALLLAFFSGAMGALWSVFSKRISGTYSILQIVILDAIISFCVAFPFSFIFQEQISIVRFFEKLPFIFLFALISLGSRTFTLLGFKYLTAQVASIGMLLEVVFGVLFGWFFFQETLSSVQIVGGAFIVLSLFLGGLLEKRFAG